MPGQVRVQVEPPLQLTEQVPVQVMLQVDPPLQLTLALGPTVTLQLELPLQASEQDAPQLPLPSLPLVQVALQLPPLQPPWDRSQAVPAVQVQLDPVQVGGCAELQCTVVSSARPHRAIPMFLISVMFFVS